MAAHRLRRLATRVAVGDGESTTASSAPWIRLCRYPAFDRMGKAQHNWLTNLLIVKPNRMTAALDKIFEALASGPRRQILAYLSEAELTTSELAQRFDMSTPAVSRHLSVLENAGLVTSQRCGQFVHYALNRDSLVTSLTGYAFELCPVGRPLKRESKALAKRRAPKASLRP